MKVARRPTIVITGAGLVTGLGLNKADTWRRVEAGETGVGPLTALEQPPAPNRGGAEAPLRQNNTNKSEPREVVILRMAVREAIVDAGLEGRWPEAHRCGIVLGTTLAGMRSGGQFFRTGRIQPMRDFLASSTLQSAMSDVPCAGPAMTTCSACASGLSSIALAVTMLQNGTVDLVLAGGYDAMSEYAYAGFNSLRLISDDPIMPFSRNRSGMKLGEGAAIVVLERADDAKRRGANAMAEVCGAGESSDAHHLTQPHPEGDGAARAMTHALHAAGLTQDDINLICAHATATPANDAAEFQAYRRVFGDRINHVSVTAFKSHVGHTLGGAGAVELVLALLARRNSCIPPVAGTREQDIEFAELKLPTGAPLRREIRHSMNVSMGFGGANACVILGPVPRQNDNIEAHAPRNTAPGGSGPNQRDVLITGVGVVLPHCIGNDAFIARLRDARANPMNADSGPIEESSYEHLVNARRARRLSTFARMLLAATTAACRDGDLEALLTGEAPCSAILGSTHGAAEYSETYYRQIVAEGLDAANPMLFAEGVPNVGSAQLSLMLNLRGGSQTLVGSRAAGLDAITMAGERIRNGEWERALVGAAEEFSDTVNTMYRQCRFGSEQSGAPGELKNGPFIGCGAVVLLLESGRVAMERRARVRGKLESSGSARSTGKRGRAGLSSELTDHLTRLLNDQRAGNAIIGSANGSWIDSIESGAIARLNGHGGRGAAIGSIHPVIGETFSVGALAGIAAVLLTGRLPGQVKADSYDADLTEPVDRFTSLAIDFSGVATAVTIDPAG